jgi:hypothetical protein
MSDMTEARVREILNGCEGVTPGPWKFEGSIYENMGAGVRSIPDDRGFAQLWNSDHVALDAAHIAHCDPDTVRSLCTLALSAIALRQPVGAWRDPTSAPKDGTTVILHLGNTTPAGLVAPGRWAEPGLWEIFPTGAWSTILGWMPLPALTKPEDSQ